MGFFKVYRRGHRGSKDKQPKKSKGKTPWKGRIMAWEYTQMNKKNEVQPGEISFLGKVFYRKTNP